MYFRTDNYSKSQKVTWEHTAEHYSLAFVLTPLHYNSPVYWPVTQVPPVCQLETLSKPYTALYGYSYCIQTLHCNVQL